MLRYKWSSKPCLPSRRLFRLLLLVKTQLSSNHITNQKPATFSFNGNQEVVTYAQPLVVPNLAFHVLEHLKGYILIEYEVTSLEPPKSKTGEVVINLSLN